MYLKWSCFLIICLYVDTFITCPIRHAIAPGCQIYSNGSKLICSEHLNLSSHNPEQIRTIRLYNLNKTVFYLNTFLNNYHNLHEFKVSCSNLSRIVTKNVEEHHHLEILRLNNITNLKEIDESIFSKLKNLHILDLRNNSLDSLNYKNIDFMKDIPQIYLSGNKWNCSKNIAWAYELNETIRDLGKLQCVDEYLRGKALYFVAQVKKQAIEECPTRCECTLLYIFLKVDELEPIVEVNCSKRNLSEFPEFLPKHTKIVRLNENYISDLSPLVKNPIYREVSDLYIDHNLIQSIDILEGSYWLANFRALSLSNNNLSELPTYAMDNALEHNPNMPNGVFLYIANNPWRCDCIFTPGFQEDILVKYESQIKDVTDVKCAVVEDDKNSKMAIVKLSRSSICQLPSDYSIRGLDLLNGILASLIVLVLGKLAYDYYYFKKTGKLPWIVTKMP